MILRIYPFRPFPSLRVVLSVPSRKFINLPVDKKLGDRLIPVVTPENPKEATIYIKGFLRSGESPDKFDNWHHCHKQLVKKYNWDQTIYGYYWQSGKLFSVGEIPIPTATVLNAIYHFVRYIYRGIRFIPTPANIASIIFQELGLSLGRIVMQYRAANAHIEEHAVALVKNIRLLRDNNVQYIRVVAHSLGCRMLMHALQHMQEDERPNEIHLCAPAIVESKYEHLFETAAKEQLSIYYSPDDMVLNIAYALIEKEKAVGSQGLLKAYSPKVNAYNVDEVFEFLVHGEYKHRFHDVIDFVHENFTSMDKDTIIK